MYYRYVSGCCGQRSSVHCTQPAGDHLVHTHTSSPNHVCWTGQTERCNPLHPPTSDPSASSPLNLDQWYPARTTGPPEPGCGCRDMKTDPLSTQLDQALSSPMPGTWYGNPILILLVLSNHTPADLTSPWSLSPAGACICLQARKGFLGGQWAPCGRIFHLCSRWERCGIASGQDPRASPRIAVGQRSALHPWSGYTGKCLSENDKSEVFSLWSPVKAHWNCNLHIKY